MTSANRATTPREWRTRVGTSSSGQSHPSQSFQSAPQARSCLRVLRSGGNLRCAGQAPQTSESPRPLVTAGHGLWRRCGVQGGQGALGGWLKHERKPPESPPFCAVQASTDRVEVGLHNTRMRRQAGNAPASGLASGIQLEGQHEVGELGVVACQGRVRPVVAGRSRRPKAITPAKVPEW